MISNPTDLLQFSLSLVKHDMKQVNQIIRTRLASDIMLIDTLGNYIVKSGGKRLRPLILLLCAKVYGYQGKDHILLAAVIEFIHTATLLHDDVVDASAKRRGQPTANDIWGNEASVLVGDFLYSRAFEMMVETQNMQVMTILASTTNAIAEGEVLQLMNAHVPDTSEQQYLDTIYRKTAKLFESATQLAGVISDQPKKNTQALARYGMHLGTAFQLVDDILDYNADRETLGKEVGDDLAEGKPTLPLIYAMRAGTPDQARVVCCAIEKGDRSQFQTILEIIQETGALDYTLHQAKQQAQLAKQALNIIPGSDYKKALEHLADFSVLRVN